MQGILRAIGLTLALALLTAPGYASETYGLMRVRDLTPFGFLRLDMRPAATLSMERNWAIETAIATQNTWAMSPSVETYLKTLESSGRRGLGPQELDAIRTMPVESYLVDLDSTTIDLIAHYRLSPQWTAYLIASGVFYGDGFLDGTIENFHRSFGFDSFGRHAIGRHQANLIFNLKSGEYASVGAPSSGGITDPTIGVRYSGLSLAEPWSMSVEAAIKVPVAGRRLLLSSGRTDYGAQASLQRRGLRHALYVDVAACTSPGTPFPSIRTRRSFPR